MWCDAMWCDVCVAMCICVQVDASRYEEKSQVTDSDWTNTRQNESLRIFFFEVYISALKQLTTSQPPLLFGNIHLWVISSVSWDTWSPLLLLRALLWANSSPSTACLHCLHSPRSCAMRWATHGRNPAGLVPTSTTISRAAVLHHSEQDAAHEPECSHVCQWVQMSKHMEMQSCRTLFWNSLFEQSCTYFPCYHTSAL